MDNIIIITSYRPDYQLIYLYDKLKEFNFENIIIIDDGSEEEFSEIYSTLKSKGASVLENKNNSGKGMAIKKALTYVIKNFPDAPGVVIADGDGQHLPSDIKRISDILDKSEKTIIQGRRNFKSKEIPSSYKRRNKLSSAIYRIDTGNKSSDTQTGLRGIPHSLIPFAVSVAGKRFEYESNLLKEATTKKIRIRYVDIECVFPEGNTTYYRTVRDSARIMRSTLFFVMFSVISCGIDIILFAFFTRLFEGRSYSSILPATVLARCVSGTFNFFINKNLSFKNKEKIKIQMLKFFTVFTALMLLSSLLVSSLTFIPLPLFGIKMIVDSALFFVNYLAQKRWIFK